jgi:hypothetical protein
MCVLNNNKLIRNLLELFLSCKLCNCELSYGIGYLHTDLIKVSSYCDENIIVDILTLMMVTLNGSCRG